MDILHYYQLKQKYQENMNGRINKIKKKEISIKEKRAQIKKLIGKCVNCGKTGGTIFEEKNGLLKAVCGATPQCNLNLNIKRKVYDNMRELEQKNNKASENKKMNIIMTKLDYLFGLNNSKDEIVDKFNTLKSELAQINEIQLIAEKKYGDIISGVHREPLLADASLDMINEIAELKKIYQEYLVEPSPSILTTMVEKYLTTIKPLSEKIRDMNYGYYALENAEGEIEEADDPDPNVSKGEKSVIYRLVARPYRLEQIEQEQK
jgi:hypothetical protein